MKTLKSLIVKLFSLFLFFTFLNPICCQSFQNEPDGFRGIKWGVDLSKVKDMVYIGFDSAGTGNKLYKKKNEDMKFGAASLKYFIYHCTPNDKYYLVQMITAGFLNYSNLRDACFEKLVRVRDFASQKKMNTLGMAKQEV
jgi:hypothetical protein